MLSVSELWVMSNLEIDKIDRNNLVDISSVHIDPDLSSEQRMEHYIGQVKNPYCFMSGDTPVRIRFVNTEKNLSQSLINYFSNLKTK